ncbi:MAG TPA: fibrobacter succinogenes major paralogous domain-containing protein [Cyclobacteriaceae bacterium]|nr:fibrobacter succinogenes major paralogous domain-containing protein [Cyclobacteriaceae bacterium]
MKQLLISMIVLSLSYTFLCCENEAIVTSDKVMDGDGISYNTVKIGDQLWMSENLKTTKYNDGTPIPLVTDNTAWSNLKTPGYCWYNNDDGTFKNTYGALYNWYAVDTDKLCPAGWHIPTNDEWRTMINFIGDSSIAGNKMKEVGTIHWTSPNTDATNESGFTALPGGARYYNGYFADIGNFGYWWTTTEIDSTSALIRLLYCSSPGIYTDRYDKWDGYSVRCLKN